jgi:ADP-heptose:LPS heptosyltransferase
MKVLALLAEHGLAPGRYGVRAVHDAAAKHWTAAAWQALAPKLIGSRSGAGDPGQPRRRRRGSRDHAASPRIVDLTGRTRLPEAAAIRHAALLVGVDAG